MSIRRRGPTAPASHLQLKCRKVGLWDVTGCGGASAASRGRKNLLSPFFDFFAVSLPQLLFCFLSLPDFAAAPTSALFFLLYALPSRYRAGSISSLAPRGRSQTSLRTHTQPLSGLVTHPSLGEDEAPMPKIVSCEQGFTSSEKKAELGGGNKPGETTAICFSRHSESFVQLTTALHISYLPVNESDYPPVFFSQSLGNDCVKTMSNWGSDTYRLLLRRPNLKKVC